MDENSSASAVCANICSSDKDRASSKSNGERHRILRGVEPGKHAGGKHDIKQGSNSYDDHTNVKEKNHSNGAEDPRKGDVNICNKE